MSDIDFDGARVYAIPMTTRFRGIIVRDALGPEGAIRVDANGAWDIDTAVTHIAN